MTMLLVLASLVAATADPAAPTQIYTSAISPATNAIFRDESLTGDSLMAKLEPLREAGDDSAAELLVELHQFGLRGVTRDARKACDYAEPIAARRPDAAHNLATCYYSGAGRAQDMAKARVHYEAAAVGGFLKARCALGNMLIAGQGGAVDVARGLALCRSSAELGDADAQTDLAGYLLMNEVAQPDPVEARRLLDSAASRNHANALFLLAQVHLKGDGTPKDAMRAASLFERSYAAGRKDAAWFTFVSLIQREDQRGSDAMLTWLKAASEHDPDPAIRAKAALMLEQFGAVAAAAARRN